MPHHYSFFVWEAVQPKHTTILMIRCGGYLSNGNVVAILLTLSFTVLMYLWFLVHVHWWCIYSV